MMCTPAGSSSAETPEPPSPRVFLLPRTYLPLPSLPPRHFSPSSSLALLFLFLRLLASSPLPASLSSCETM
eukprot:80136-Hanusia_phi.AAC.1